MQGAGAPEGQAKAGSEQPAQAGGSRGGVLRDPRREGVDEAPPNKCCTSSSPGGIPQ